jgi:hypothetical protein
MLFLKKFLERVSIFRKFSVSLKTVAAFWKRFFFLSAFNHLTEFSIFGETLKVPD